MAEPISIQQLKDASLDVKSLEEVVNGDENVVVTTRLGETYPSVKSVLENVISKLGFIIVDSFEVGATLTQRNQALRHAEDGKLYSWAGNLPKVVPANSTPTSSGGMGDNAWLEVSDVTLRQDLANPDTGAELVGYGGDSLTQFLDVGVKNPSYLRVNKPTRSAVGVASRGGYRADSSPARPLVTFIDDDAWPAVHSYLFPLLKEKNIPFGLSIPSNRLGETNKITLAQLQEIAAGSDVEILTHGYDELYLNTLTDEEQEHELRASKEQLESYGFHVNFYVPVGGVLTANSTSIADRYYAGLFNAGHTVDRSNTVANLNEMDINRVAFGPASSLQKYKDDVDAAIANNRWLVFMTHVGAINANHIAWLPELIDYIKSRGVEIVKPSDGLAEFGQAFRQGVFSQNGDYFAVRKDGSMQSSDLERRAFVRDESRPFDAGILEYPARQVTYAHYNTSEANTPAGAGVGSLFTYRPAPAQGATEMSYQEFFTSSGIRYRRKWNRTEPWGNGNWTDWIRPETTAGFSFSATATAGELLQKAGGGAINLITASFNSGGAVTYGWPGPGTVVMYTGETFNSWQVFYHINGGGISTRSWNDGTKEWSKWLQERIIKHSAALTIGTVPPRSTVSVAVPVTGIGTGASVVVGSREALPNGIIITGHCRANGTATVDVVNVTDTDVSMVYPRDFDFKIDGSRT